MTRSLDVADLVDARPIGRLTVVVIALCALVNVLDGMDTQSIGVAAPFIAQSLGIPVASFGPVFAAALFGAALGAVAFGALADRLGRKRLLIVALLLIGVFTLLTAHAPSTGWLMACRFLAGLGLGGATPCFIALTSEYAPARHQAACVQSAATAYLRPAFGRPSFRVETEALVTGLTIADGCAWRRGGTDHLAHPRREVILCAGTIDISLIGGLLTIAIGPGSYALRPIWCSIIQ